MKKGFTLIELLFVITIIGVLAAVSIPKLALTRDNAQAIMCEEEITFLIREISNSYTIFGHNNLIKKKINDLTNIRILEYTTNSNTGIVKNYTLVDAIEYNCDGSILSKITYDNHRLAFQFFLGGSPASVQAFEILKKNLDLNDTNQRIYDFH